MNGISQSVIDSFIAACHEAGRRGLMRCSSGNLSLRLDDQRMLITASRSWLDRIRPEQLAVCRIADGGLLEGARPSVETGFHAGILRQRGDVNVVLHFQSPCATALACMEPSRINYHVIPEIAYYLGVIGYVPYLTPGSESLACAVIEAMRDHDLIVLRNHGLVTAARDFDMAIQNAEFFELACSVILHGKDSVVPLGPEGINQLLALRQEAMRSV